MIFGWGEGLNQLAAYGVKKAAAYAYEVSGAEALVDGAKDVFAAGVRGAITGAKAVGTGVRDAAVTVARKGAAGAVVGTTTIGAVGVGVPVAGTALLAKKTADAGKAIKNKFSPTKPSLTPAVKCETVSGESAESRAVRINKRNQLISQAEQSGDPRMASTARQLKEDMQAVEMARLSANVYTQYDTEGKETPSPLPKPWKALSDEELDEAGVNLKDLKDSKAVVYQLPPDFPMEPKTILAFRGTTSEKEDIFTDHDQALGLKTKQYTAAANLGRDFNRIFPGAQTTGHSLGGGKAQAAAITGGLKGMMFNSAGVHPNSVSPNDPEQFAGNLIQYRAAGGMGKGFGDPLTGMQNSPAAQKALYGTVKGSSLVGKANMWALNELGVDTGRLVPDGAKEIVDRILNVTPEEAEKNYKLSGGKWYIPPAIGEVRGLTSKNADGTDGPIASQHSVINMVNGFESRKFENVKSLLLNTGSTEDASTYFGPLAVVYR